MLKTLKSIVATALNWDWLYSLRSYSQEGEDIILRKVFDKQNTGTYVDIGAHHPFRYSNTQYFYKLGWHGVNVDATPGSMAPFRQVRTRDVNLETLVTDQKKPVTYYLFEDPALNTLSKTRAEAVIHAHQSRLMKKVQLPTQSLANILDTNLSSPAIDFLTIDVEGAELEVLSSNNWKKYQPRVIVVETLNTQDLTQLAKDPLVRFLAQKKYHVFARTFNTAYFRKK